jgi:predicted acetyltransferase
MARMDASNDDPLAGLELRTAAEPGDLRTFLGHLETAFSEDISEEDWGDLEATMPIERVLAMFDGDQPVGSAADVPFAMTVPGGARLAVAGVTLVGVLPTHRRRGILRRLMLHQLQTIRDRGEPIAVLWASEGAIYQRFGYGSATFATSFEIERTRAAITRPPMASAHVRLLDEAEAARLFPPIYDAVAARTPGMLSRDEGWWRHSVLSDSPARRAEMGRKRLALLEIDGLPVAFAMHRIKSDWDGRGPKNVLTALEVMGLDGAAEIEMWRWLLGVDLVGIIRGVRGPLVHPLMLALAEPRRLGLTIGDGLWLRLVDLAGALEGRQYAAPGSLVMDVVDASCPWNAGRWRLTVDGRPGAAPGATRPGHVTRTEDAADLRMDAADLGAIYLGGTRISELRAAGRVEELSPGAAALASAVFASDVAPLCTTMF